MDITALTVSGYKTGAMYLMDRSFKMIPVPFPAFHQLRTRQVGFRKTYKKVLQVIGRKVESLGISYSGRFEPFGELNIVGVSIVSIESHVCSSQLGTDIMVKAGDIRGTRSTYWKTSRSPQATGHSNLPRSSHPSPLSFQHLSASALAVL